MYFFRLARPSPGFASVRFPCASPAPVRPSAAVYAEHGIDMVGDSLSKNPWSRDVRTAVPCPCVEGGGCDGVSWLNRLLKFGYMLLFLL